MFFCLPTLINFLYFWYQPADLKIAVPVTKAYVASSTFTRWIEVIGERSSIVGLNGIYTASPCLNQRINAKQTADFSAASYNASGFFLVRCDCSSGSFLITLINA
jgi:hypothetical protein